MRNPKSVKWRTGCKRFLIVGENRSHDALPARARVVLGSSGAVGVTLTTVSSLSLYWQDFAFRFFGDKAPKMSCFAKLAPSLRRTVAQRQN